MKFDSIVTATLVVCAVITTGVVLRRELMTPAASPSLAERKPVLVPRWRDDLEKGIRLGPGAAPVQLIEFADFESPFCGTFHQTLRVVRERYPTQVAATYVHFPPMHRFAIPAARVAECAGEQGRFEAMYDHLCDEQESFGLEPWSEFAAAAGVPDGGAFETCIKRCTDPVPRVVDGQQLGKDLDVRATPTLIVNGWKLGHPPSEQGLDAMVKAVLEGKDPVPKAGKS